MLIYVFFSTTPFCSRVSVYKVWWMVPSKASNSWKLLEVYSPPKSHLKHLITIEYWVLIKAQKVVYISKNSEWYFIR